MSEGSSAKEISLGYGFGEVALKVNGATVEVHADGSIAAHTAGDVDAWTNGSVRVHAPANDTAKIKTTPEIGDEMEDGTIYAGISPYTGNPMYATPANAPLTYTFNQAQEYAEKLDAHGHKDWRAPSKGELNVLWENRNKGKLAGTFNETGSDPAGWYWSSSPYGNYFGWAQRFSDGYQNDVFRYGGSSLRLVR